MGAMIDPKVKQYKGKNKKDENMQNLSISVGYELAEQALMQLMKMNITVLDLSVTSTTPRIQVMYSRSCLRLKGAHQFSTKNAHGQRVYGYRAMLNHCQIEWDQPYIH